MVQTYTGPDCDLLHCDLYRLESVHEVLELGLDAAFGQAICLVEWPDRLGTLVPADPLTLVFSALVNKHHIQIEGSDRWKHRLESILG